MDDTTLPPPVLQVGPTDCGLCAIKYVLNRAGLDADIEVLRQTCRWGIGTTGTYMPILVECLVRDYGFEALWPHQIRNEYGLFWRNGLARLRRGLSEGWIGLTSRRYGASMGHHLVVDALDESDNLLVACSVCGRRWWSKDEFFGGFDGGGDGRLWWLVRPTERERV